MFKNWFKPNSYYLQYLSPNSKLPLLKQSHSLFSNKKAFGTGSNTLGEVQDYLKDLLFKKDVANEEPDQPFFYHSEFELVLMLITHLLCLQVKSCWEWRQMMKQFSILYI